MPRLLIAIAISATAYLSGCGSSGGEDTPVDCLAGAAPVRQALISAPGDVKLAGKTPISDCIVKGQSGGELSQVGQALVLSATQLNQAARSRPDGPYAVQLGYLVGAVQKGAEDTGGIHADLLRRLSAAAGFVPAGESLPQSFQVGYLKGQQAGQQGG